MLFDPKWEVETKPDVFSLEGLIAWLEKQPADKEYCFLDNGACLLFQYFEVMDLAPIAVGGITANLSSGVITLSDEFRIVARSGPRTFGAALTRARKALDR